LAQTAYTVRPEPALPGTFAGSSARDSITVAAAAVQELGNGSGINTGGDLTPGRLVVRRDQVAEEHARAIAPVALAADPDAILETGASSASPQTITASSLDGVIGADYLPVPAQLDFTFSSSTDWDATTATITGVDADGTLITEVISIPEDGNAVVTTTASFWAVTEIFIPAQTGAGGTFTVGVTAAGRTLSSALVLGVVEVEENYPDSPAIPAGRACATARLGRWWVETNAQVSPGSAAYVQVVAGVGKPLGSFRGDADSGDAVRLDGAVFVTAHSASLAVVELGEV